MPSTSKDADSTSPNTGSPSLTWSNALALLEQSTASSSLASFLSSNLEALQNPADPFSSTSSKPTSTALVPSTGGGSFTKLQQTAAKEVGERFQVAQRTAELAVKSCVENARKDRERLSEQEWDQLTAWVFEERMAVIAVVSLLFRIHEDPEHPCYSLAAQHMSKILHTSFASGILDSLVKRTSEVLPLPVRQSAIHSRFWTTQLVLEQKALLELLFLSFYSSSFEIHGSHIRQVLETIRHTQWGSRQDLFGYFDDEAQGIVREIGFLYNIIAVEVLSLEAVMERSESPYPVPAPGEPPVSSTSPYHPSTLTALNQTVESLVQLDGERASPILLGWAFVLSRVTESLLERGVPNEYHELAQASLRVETGSGNSGSPQPLFHLYASHALSPSSALFPTLLSILRSPLCGFVDATGSSASGDPNTVGYISVLRGLILTLPQLVRLSFLGESQLDGLFDTFSALYSNPSACSLCSNFWSELRTDQADDETSMLIGPPSAQTEAEREIIDLAKSRFPVQFGPFARIVRALSAGVAAFVDPVNHPDVPAERLATECAETAYGYLAALPTLTHVVPSGPSPLPLPYESLSYPDPETGYSVRCTRPIRVSPSIAIREGTMGRLVSPPGRKPVVVAWDVADGWSAWQLMGDVLAEYAGYGRRQKRGGKGETDVFGGGAGGEGALPVEWDTEEEKQRDITAILDIFTLTLRSDPSLGVALVEHLSSGTQDDPTRPELVEVLFKILDRSLGLGVVPAKVVSSLIELVAALLPSFPGVVWTFLRGSALLFPSRHATKTSSSFNGSTSASSVLATEKLAGQYPVTNSLLTLLQSLVLEAQVSSCVTSPEYRSIKEGVLVRALNWVKDEVWTVYSSWRFTALGEKFHLARRIIEIFDLVLEEGELEPQVSTGRFSAPTKIVTEAFLFNASTAGIAQLLPLLSTFALGPDSIILLRKAGKFNDAAALEDLIGSALDFALKLLRLRSRVAGSRSSLLEKLLLSQNSTANLPSSSPFSGFASFNSATGQRRPEPLESIAALVTAPLSTSVAIRAARVVALVSVGANGQATKDQTSMMALLGGNDRAEKLVVSLLAIVEDSDGPSEVQVAVWDLISAFVDSQPGLALLLVTGRQYPFSEEASLPSAGEKGKGKESTASEPKLVALARSLAPPPQKPLARTAIGVALETVGTWRDAWADRPTVLVAVLRFFDFVWQHLAEYGPSLDDFRSRPAAWKTFVEIAFEDAGSPSDRDDDVESYCFRIMAKAHAVRIVALDIEASLQRHGAKAADSSSFKAFAEVLRDGKKLLGTLGSAVSSSCAPELHRGIYALVSSTFAELDLDTLRQAGPAHPLDEARQFGASYMYSLPLVRRKLDGFMADRDHDDSSMVDPEAFADVVGQIARLNCNFPLLEAEISGTRSWRQVLEVILPLIRKDEGAQKAALAVVGAVAKDVADEDRGGQVMAAIQSERLEILSSLVEVVRGAPAATAKDALVGLLTDASSIVTSETFDFLGSISQRRTPALHSSALRIAFDLVRHLNTLYPEAQQAAALSSDQRSTVNSAVDSILRATLTAVRDLFVLARTVKSREIEQDLSLSIAVATQIFRCIFAPSPAVWLAHCHSLDLFRTGLEVFVYMEQLDGGRPLYAQHVLDFCLAVATTSPRAAEQLALEGVMTALTNNALTAAAEAGAINLTSPADGSRTPQHELWTSMLALVVALVSALGESTRFVEQDVTGFVRLYGAQVAEAMAWQSTMPVTAAGTEETAAVVSVMHGLTKASSRAGGSSPAIAVASVFVEQSLNLLQHLVYALLHPNHLSSLVDATSPEERGWLEKEADETDLAKRPVSAAVTLAFVHLARDIVSSLVDYTDAWKTLTKDPMEWSTHGAVVLPTATVTPTDKASVGTLLDLVSFCIDSLRSPPFDVKTPPTFAATFQTLPDPTSASLRAACSEALEATAVLAATQLGLYRKIGAGPQPGEKGSAFARTLSELATEVLESVDKAISAEGGKGSEKSWLLRAVKAKVASWI
ncbi:hypothetical protein JCM10212_004076 [Sporobolomyces blumeae]